MNTAVIRDWQITAILPNNKFIETDCNSGDTRRTMKHKIHNWHVYKHYCWLWSDAQNDPMDLCYIREWIEQEIDCQKLIIWSKSVPD